MGTQHTTDSVARTTDSSSAISADTNRLPQTRTRWRPLWLRSVTPCLSPCTLDLPSSTTAVECTTTVCASTVSSTTLSWLWATTSRDLILTGSSRTPGAQGGEIMDTST